MAPSGRRLTAPQCSTPQGHTVTVLPTWTNPALSLRQFSLRALKSAVEPASCSVCCCGPLSEDMSWQELFVYCSFGSLGRHGHPRLRLSARALFCLCLLSGFLGPSNNSLIPEWGWRRSKKSIYRTASLANPGGLPVQSLHSTCHCRLVCMLP